MKSHTIGAEGARDRVLWRETWKAEHARALPQTNIGAGASHHSCETLFQAEEMVEVEWRRKKNHAYNWTKINAVMVCVAFCFFT